jgi:hypothetical protein
MVGTRTAAVVAFSYFDAPFQVFFSELTERALAQSEVLLSSPGTVVTLEKNGRRYLYWRVYDAQGKRRDHYIGAENAPATDTALAEIRSRIAEARQFADGSLVLRKQGYAAADNSAALTLAALFNAGVFRHGAMLVGTHAFGAILNALGVRLPANYYTEDIDVARYGAIQLATRPEEGIIGILRQSGLPFVEVPELDVRKPSTSFRVRGRKLAVDLLVPGGTRYRTRRIPELGAHATALPFLDYLLEGGVPAVVLGRDHVVPVRVPNAARYCLHKLIVATLRASRAAAKADKDIAQSAVLAAVLREKFEGDLLEAARRVPVGARKRLAQSARRAAALIGDRHPAGRDFLAGLYER